MSSCSRSASSQSISRKCSGTQCALWAGGGHSREQERKEQHTLEAFSWTLLNTALFKQTSSPLSSAPASLVRELVAEPTVLHGEPLKACKIMPKSWLSKLKMPFAILNTILTSGFSQGTQALWCYSTQGDWSVLGLFGGFHISHRQVLRSTKKTCSQTHFVWQKCSIVQFQNSIVVTFIYGNVSN